MLFKRLLLLIASAMLLGSAPAFAYIDPGTGSALIQGIIAAIAAIGVTVKLYWHRITKIFTSKDRVAEGTDCSESEE